MKIWKSKMKTQVIRAEYSPAIQQSHSALTHSRRNIRSMSNLGPGKLTSSRKTESGFTSSVRLSSPFCEMRVSVWVCEWERERESVCVCVCWCALGCAFGFTRVDVVVSLCMSVWRVAAHACVQFARTLDKSTATRVNSESSGHFFFVCACKK